MTSKPSRRQPDPQVIAIGVGKQYADWLEYLSLADTPDNKSLYYDLKRKASNAGSTQFKRQV